MASIYEYDGSKGDDWVGLDDLFFLGDASFLEIWGDVTVDLFGGAKGGDDTLEAGDNAYSVEIFGDATSLLENSVGGADTIIVGANNTYAFIYGDSQRMEDFSVGGNDEIFGGETGFQEFLYGDANWISGNANAGDDVLWGGDHVSDGSYLFGDGDLSAQAIGGDDILHGGDHSAVVILTGDGLMRNYATGGNDILIAGDGCSVVVMQGDSQQINGIGGLVTAGDDLLVSGDNKITWLYGDAQEAVGALICGNDTLVSGPGVDEMWGDLGRDLSTSLITGADVFVFDFDNGADIIHDFERGKDIVDLSALDLFMPPGNAPLSHLSPRAIAKLKDAPPSKIEFEVLDSNGNGILDDGDDAIQVVNGGLDTVIDLGLTRGEAAVEDTILLTGVTGLEADDFLF